jgi:hypothetical protein
MYSGTQAFIPFIAALIFVIVSNYMLVQRKNSIFYLGDKFITALLG